MKKRYSGVLMHITSLPGDLGIGTLGKEAREFIDFLAETKQSYWQILPLTTTSYGDSPYQSFSAIAGNINLIDFYELIKLKVLRIEDFKYQNFGKDKEKIDYELLFKGRKQILEKAVRNFLLEEKNKILIDEFIKNNSWLKDYAEFMAIKEYFNFVDFSNWDKKIINRDKEILDYYRVKLKDKINYYIVTQYFFFTQWQDIKKYANEKSIKIIGDIPIYVSSDSVEMWVMPELFKTINNKCEFVAGVPADDFSPEGQLWGNPIYDWEYHKKTEYSWWINRIKESFKLYDVVRIDHFKGFSDYWQVKKESTTAKIGTWEKGPGIDFFNKIKEVLGELSIIAEDLGQIDEKTKKLLLDTGYPGMKVLQFAFYDKFSPYLPHNIDYNSITYIGTHDNETTLGWFNNLDENTRNYVLNYTNKNNNENINKTMIRLAHATNSKISIITMQDLLNRDNDSRMNTPSTLGNNWKWRMLKEELTEDKKNFLKHITILYSREG